jgi:hypothetical protein
MKHQTSRLLYVGICMLCCWGILGLVVKQTSHVAVIEQVPIAVDTMAPAVAHTPVLSCLSGYAAKSARDKCARHYTCCFICKE